MNYNVIPVETEEHDYVWCVMEKATEQLIQAFMFSEDAQTYSDFLDKGGGFDGWTPTFILQEIVPMKDMNQELTAYLSF